MPMMTMPTAVMSDLSDSAPTRPTARPHMKTAEARMTTVLTPRRFKAQPPFSRSIPPARALFKSHALEFQQPPLDV